MKPKKYPYSGKMKLTKKKLPRFIKIGRIALNSKIIEHIEAIVRLGDGRTRLIIKAPKAFWQTEEKTITVYLEHDEVVKILNQY